MMEKNRIKWMISAGLLGLLGFASCSPRLRPRPETKDVDTLVVPPADTLKPVSPGEYAPIKLMYGVPPVRYEVREVVPPER